MRRDYLLIAALAAALLALLAGGAAVLAGPAVPDDLLPPGATLISVHGRGPGRVVLVAQVAPRQSRHNVYRHLVGAGWRLRRVNVPPEDAVQELFRRRLGGHLIEAVALTRDPRDRRVVTISYYRCLRRVTCGWP